MLGGTRSPQGVSLLEILVILIIVSVLVAIAVPNFIYFNQQYRLASTTQTLYYALQYARSEAIKRNATVFVSFNTTDNWCYGINVGSACNCAIANNCNLGSTSAPRLQDMVLSLTGTSVQFEGTRGAAGSSNTIKYTLYGQTTYMGIDITALGNLQLCSPTVSGYSAC